ncbi:MAG: multiple sugar transport system permease protein [Erysipelotrichaceae bacterium]|nr:MAG: multiple sugar transport system permease [Erysipelotrichaceae bacterium]TXT18405.1 MAG: multiple sugar transport system permease protein [Erysipelotrichaceae bacterium]
MAFQGTKINPKRFDKSQLKFYIVLVPMALFMVLPVIYIVNQAFKPLDELFMFPPRFFVIKPTLKNFTDLFRTASTTGVPMSRYLFNSIVVTLVTVFANILVTASSAYVLSKKKFKMKHRLFALNQIALMFVPIAVAIPRFLIIKNVGLSDNFLAHIVPLLAMPIGLFLVKQFMDDIPDALIEAARLDGANDFQILLKIVMPLVKPALATVGILTFQVVWNATESSSLYISDETLKTFAFYLSTLTASSNVIAGAGMSAAAGLIMFLPNLIIFMMLQSKVMNTMTHSGIK